MNLLLIVCGFIIEKIRRFNAAALKQYNTYVFKKKVNPQIIHIGSETKWNNIQNIKIGDNTYINGAKLFTTDQSFIEIGNNCLISYDVNIRTNMHKHDMNCPIIQQGEYAENIIIEDNVWVGHGAYIMPGVVIGENSIIGAQAVVTKSIPPNSVAVGVPAKVVKSR